MLISEFLTFSHDSSLFLLLPTSFSADQTGTETVTMQQVVLRHRRRPQGGGCKRHSFLPADLPAGHRSGSITRSPMHNVGFTSNQFLIFFSLFFCFSPPDQRCPGLHGAVHRKSLGRRDRPHRRFLHYKEQMDQDRPTNALVSYNIGSAKC